MTKLTVASSTKSARGTTIVPMDCCSICCSPSSLLLPNRDIKVIESVSTSTDWRKRAVGMTPPGSTRKAPGKDLRGRGREGTDSGAAESSSLFAAELITSEPVISEVADDGAAKALWKAISRGGSIE